MISAAGKSSSRIENAEWTVHFAFSILDFELQDSFVFTFSIFSRSDLS